MNAKNQLQMFIEQEAREFGVSEDVMRQRIAVDVYAGYTSFDPRTPSRPVLYAGRAVASSARELFATMERASRQAAALDTSRRKAASLGPRVDGFAAHASVILFPRLIDR